MIFTLSIRKICIYHNEVCNPAMCLCVCLSENSSWTVSDLLHVWRKDAYHTGGWPKRCFMAKSQRSRSPRWSVLQPNEVSQPSAFTYDIFMIILADECFFLWERNLYFEGIHDYHCFFCDSTSVHVWNHFSTTLCWC